MNCQVVLKGDLMDTVLAILFRVLLQTKSNLPFTSAIQYHPESTRSILTSRGKPVSVSI